MSSKLIKPIFIMLLILVCDNLFAQLDTTYFYTYPIYDGINNKICINWRTKTPIGDSINIYRKNETTTLKIAGGIPLTTTTYIDNTALPKQMYEYQIFLYSGGVINDSTNISQSILAIKWPIADETYHVGAVFGDITPGNIWHYHEGVDFVGQNKNVVAVRGGVIYRENFNTDILKIKVDIGGGNYEYDIYVHLADSSFFANKKAVYAGEKIGVIDSLSYQPEYNHLHYTLLNSFDISFTAIAGVSYPNGSNLENPLPVFDDILYNSGVLTPIDPYSTSPIIRLPKYKKNNSYNRLSKDSLYKEVDISVEIWDLMANDYSLNKRPSIYKLGYYVKNIEGGGSGVRSETNPYIVCKFDNDWFNDPLNPVDATYTLNLNNTINKHKFVDVSLITLFPGSAYYRSYLITNCKGITGKIAELDSMQNWNTRAKIGTGSAPNGSDADSALINADAKFKDGKYVVFIVAEDLVNKSQRPDTVIVDNFLPYINSLEVKPTDYKSSPFYSFSWQLNGSMLNAVGYTSPIPIGTDVKAVITFSEPVKNFEFHIPAINIHNVFIFDQQVDSQIVYFSIPILSNISDLQIEMNCNDLSGNSSYSFSDINQTYTPAYRTGNNQTDFNVINTQVYDNSHKITLATNNFLVPSTAFPTIQSAINYVYNNNLSNIEVLVSAGTYSESINLKGLKNFKLIGDEISPQNVIIDGGGNAMVVMISNGEDTTTVLSGFTITNGFQGIICNNNSSPVLKNLIVEYNGSFAKDKNIKKDTNFIEATSHPKYTGSGISISNSNAVLKNLIVRYNSYISCLGGGIGITQNCNIKLENVLIENNSAYIGGGMMINASNVEFTEVIIQNNTASYCAGGIYSESSLPKNKNLQILNNVAPYGAGLCLFYNTNCTFKNILISGNQPDGVYNNMSYSTFENITVVNHKVGFYNNGTYSRINNSIIRGNDSCDLNISSKLYLSYSNIGNKICGNLSNLFYETGNISADPLFVNAKSGNYYLQPKSPSINRGIPIPTYNDDDQTRNDMGACRNNITAFIDGDSVLCESAFTTFKIDANPIFTYNWIIPSGWQIKNGQGTNQIEVKTNSQNGAVRVEVNNGIQTITSEPKNILIKRLPFETKIISGEEVPCINTIAKYSINAITYATGYKWSFPKNWEIVGVDTLNQIFVKVGSNFGNVVVTPYNSCGYGPQNIKEVAPANNIKGLDTIKLLSSRYQYYSVDNNMSNTVFTWSVPTGWVIVSGQGTNKIKTTFSQSGYIGVTTNTNYRYCQKYVTVIRNKNDDFFIADENAESYLIVYPNPSSDYLNIKISNNENTNSELSIYNILGQKENTIKLENTNYLEITDYYIGDLENGVYFIKIENTNLPTIKFIKN